MSGPEPTGQHVDLSLHDVQPPLHLVHRFIYPTERGIDALQELARHHEVLHGQSN